MSDHFSTIAEGYARYRPTYPPELFAWLAGLPERPRVAWDVATGNGQAAVALAAHFERVEATDHSAAQIARAVAHPRVAYRVAPAEESGLTDGSVDLVTVAQALHWLDHDRFNREVERVLAPGGAIAAWCYNLLDVDPAVNAVLRRYYAEIAGPYWPAERRLLEDGYRTIPFPFAPLSDGEPPEFAMRAAWRLADLVGYLGTWSATDRYRAARGEDPVALVAADLAAAWGDPAVAKEIRWPLSLRVGRPQKDGG